MFRTSLFPALCMLGAIINPTTAQCRAHRITITTHQHTPVHVNTAMGHIGGYTPAMDESSSTYRSIDSQCAAQGLNNVSSQSATVGVSLGTRRNFYANCMVQNGAWRQGRKD